MKKEIIIEKACSFLKALFHDMPEMLDIIEGCRKDKSVNMLKAYMSGVALTAYKMANDLDLLTRAEAKEKIEHEVQEDKKS